MDLEEGCVNENLKMSPGRGFVLGDALNLCVRHSDIFLIEYAFECIHNLFALNLMFRRFFSSLLLKNQP